MVIDVSLAAECCRRVTAGMMMMMSKEDGAETSGCAEEESLKLRVNVLIL